MERSFLENLGLTEEAVEAILGEQARLDAERAFQAALTEAVRQCRGRNETAITALLDLDALRGSQEPGKAARRAVEALRREHGYLFEEEPGYAAGTGTRMTGSPEQPQTLAGALRERYCIR